MKISFPRPWLSAVLAALALPIATHAQMREIPLSDSLEEPPVLEAATNLLPEYLTGPHHKVTGSFSTSASHNQYTVESEYGNGPVDGSLALVELVKEYQAIEKLRKVIAGKNYAEAAKKAGEIPAAKKITPAAALPVDGAASGPWKIMERAVLAASKAPEREVPKEAAKDVLKALDPGIDKDLAGFTLAKRQVAAELDVDPYSSNAVLQKELNNVTWAIQGSGAKVLAVLGEAAKSKSGGTDPGTAVAPVPEDVRADVQARLAKIGVAQDAITAFLDNPAYTPSAEAQLVKALEGMEGIEGRPEFLRLANAAQNPSEAWFFARSAEVIVGVKSQVHLTHVVSHRGLPLFVSEDGVAFMALEWDYASWTRRAGEFIVSLKPSLFKKDEVTGFHIVLTGVASDRFADELGQRDIGLSEKALPCPIKKEVKSGSLSTPRPGLLAGQ